MPQNFLRTLSEVDDAAWLRWGRRDVPYPDGFGPRRIFSGNHTAICINGYAFEARHISAGWRFNGGFL